MRTEHWQQRVYSMLAVVTLSTMIAAIPVMAQRENESESDRRKRDYVHAMFGPITLGRITANTIIDQATDSPEDWDQDVGGFGQRLASNAGARWINVSVRHGIAAYQDRTTKYQPCECTDTMGRVRQALLGAVTDFDDRGRRHFSVAQVSGAVAGSSAKIIWEPDYGVGDAARGTVQSLLVTAAGNLIREFVFNY